MNKNDKLWKKIIATVIPIIIITGSLIMLNEQEDAKYVGAQDVPYTTFTKRMEDGEIEAVHILFTRDNFFFYDKEGELFETDNPRYADFKKDLLTNDVDVVPLKGKIDYVTIIASFSQFFFIFLIFAYFMKKAGPSFGDKKSSVVAEKPTVKFSDIAGLDESMLDIQYMVEFLKNPAKYSDAGAKLPKGVILYGPPGTGKTLTAKAIAGEANVPFLSVSGSDFIEMYVGLGARRVRKLFEEARSKAPCILFIDEIDAVGGSRSDAAFHSEGAQTLNALLTEMDGFNTKDGIIVVAATNRIGDLDPALIRPGRFDRQVAISLPDSEGRKEILQIHAKNKKLAEDVNLDIWAKMTIGFSGAALEMLMNEATIQAVNNGSEIVRQTDIDEAYYKTVMKGNKKKNANPDKEEIKLVAYHEAGHALIGKLLTDNDIPKVSIIPTTSGAGGVTFNIPKKMGLFTKNEILNNIKMLYAGRAAEEILRGGDKNVTIGASSDIEQATNYIKSYFEVFGFSEEFGMLKLDMFEEGSCIEEAKKLSNDLYKETREFLQNNWDKVELIADELIEKETLDEDDLNRIIG